MNLEDYKNKFNNKKVILFGPGKTLNDYKPLTGEFMLSGVNGTIIHDNFRNLDIYFWAGDLDTRKHPTPSEKPIRESLKYLNPNCIKFTNTTINKKSKHPFLGQTQILESDAKNLGFITYDICFGKNNESNEIWHKDLKKGLDSCSIAFASLQLLLFMGFSEIILVGFDCGNTHSYENIITNDKCDWKNNFLIDRWKLFKNYIKCNFPNVKLYVINPIGLKDIFPEYN